MTFPIKQKLFTMMVLEIAIWGAWQIKIFPYMGLLGFTAGQQGAVGSVFAIASLLGIFFGNQFADRHFAAERFLTFSHLVGGLALIATAFARDFTWFFCLFLVYGVLYVPTLSIANSVAFTHLKHPANDFGYVRMGGTVGWILVSWPFIFLLGAEADARQTRSIFIVAGILSIILAAYSLTLPHTKAHRNVQGSDRLAWLRTARMFGVRYIAVLFIVIFLDALIHNGYFVVIDGFLNHVGIAPGLTMVVSSIGQIAEIAAMLLLGTVLNKLGWKWTMIIGVMGHAVRYAIFAFFGNADHQWLIIAVQVLHGICYAFFFATVYIFIDAVFPKDVRASAQGTANLLILGLGMLAASQLFPRLMVFFTVSRVTVAHTAAVDYRNLFLVPMSIALFGALLLLLFFKPPAKRPAEVP